MATVHIRAYKPDGSMHQSWEAELVARFGDWIVIRSPYGTRVQHHTKQLSYAMAHSNLGMFNTCEYYNVFIDFTAEGRLKMLYINVATPAIMRGNEISWRDLYLDVIRLPGHSAELVDQDEFEEAKNTGTLTADLIAKTEATARELMEAVNRGEPPFLTADYEQTLEHLKRMEEKETAHV